MEIIKQTIKTNDKRMRKRAIIVNMVFQNFQPVSLWNRWCLVVIKMKKKIVHEQIGG